MTKRNPYPLPRGLGVAGKALWRNVTAEVDADWRLDARDLALLGEAARTADDLAALERAVKREGPLSPGSKGQVRVHPAVCEARQLRLVLARLLGQIELSG